ncbi:MAG: glycoside hydrolase family 18 [Bacteroidales bacterium]|nr:glycoside hydrolase family 18 [Bacteroidales bacterium]
MKKLTLVSALCLAMFTIASCGGGGNGKEDIDPEEKPEVDPEINEPTVTLNPQVAGRCALGYVTYYGTSIPECYFMTHMNYAFAELYIRDNVYKGFKVQGSMDRFLNVTRAAKLSNPNIKICLSFTNGIANSDNKIDGGFSALCASPENRTAFAADCLTFITENNIDGIDLDWEYPGLSWSNAACDKAHDTANYAELVKTLRETLGDQYLITYAGYCTDKQAVDGGYKFIDIAAMDPYVDYVNIMAYDFDEAPHHHSALSDNRAYKDCYRAVAAYTNAGVATSKLVLGVPFYGRISFSKSPGAVSYRKILQLSRTQYRRNKWDDIASCPYVEVMKGNSFYCGYDNPRSIALKGAWVRAKGMYGLMYWEYDQDDDRHTLAKSVWNAVMQ